MTNALGVTVTTVEQSTEQGPLLWTPCQVTKPEPRFGRLVTWRCPNRGNGLDTPVWTAEWSSLSARMYDSFNFSDLRLQILVKIVRRPRRRHCNGGMVTCHGVVRLVLG